MSSVSTLEAERRAILDRMHARRDTYRSMLTNGTSLQEAPVAHQVAGTHIYSYSPAPASFPRSTLMRVITEHPVLVAAGIAAVIVIGPKRIMRTVSSGGAAVAALSARNNSNIDMIGRLLTMAGAYAQGRSNRKH